MAVTFFPSNPNVSAAVQAQFGANAAVDVAKLRAQEARALAQMQMQQQQQEGFWRQQQAQQQDALAREQLKSEDFFRRGQLTNASEQAKAQMAAAEAKNMFIASENEKDRANQIALSSIPRAQEALRAQDLNMEVGQLADAAKNYAEILNQKEALDTAALQIGKTSIMEDKRTFWNAPGNPLKPSQIVDYWFRGDSQRKSNVLSNLPKQIGSAPVTPDMAMSPTENIGQVKVQLEAQNAALSKIIAAGSANGLDAHVTKGPDGKWVATLNKPTDGAMTVPTATVAPTSGTPRYFNSPAVGTNLPPIIKFDPRSGRPIAYDAVTKQAIGYAN